MSNGTNMLHVARTVSLDSVNRRISGFYNYLEFGSRALHRPSVPRVFMHVLPGHLHVVIPADLLSTRWVVCLHVRRLQIT